MHIPLKNKLARFALALTLLLLPLAVARAAAAGGEVSGTVTDPKGAVVVGASVEVVDAATGAAVATGATDGQGRYSLPNVPAGAYAVVVRAGGFKEARREQLKVEEGKRASADFRLEVALAETSVTVSAAVKGNADPVYQQLRQQGESPQEFAGDYAQVNGLVLKRDAATFTLRSGELYFLAPVEGRVTGAVFIGEGEMTLTPPVECEKKSLALFTGQPSITEQFTKLTLRFTDKTFEEIKASPQARMATGGAQSARARDIFRDNQTLLRRELRTNAELRTLVDLYTPERPGFFVAFIGGKHFEKLVFQIDPLGIPEVSPEEVLLSSYGETDGGFWTAFHLSDEYRQGKGNSDEDHRIFDITHHDIDGAIKGTQIAATDTVAFTPLIKGTRVLPFELYRTLRVSRVRDEQGRDLQFIQEGKERDSDFALIWPEPLEAGKSYKVTVEYQGGDALINAGGGNFFVVPDARHTWYPNNGGTQFGDRATFDMTFHYPKGKMLIGTGAQPVAEVVDGDIAVAKWSSGQTELAVAGFNYGIFKRKAVEDKESGYEIEFYANENLPDFMRGAENAGVGSMSTTAMANSAIADAQNSTRIYNAFFGKLPYTRVAMTQQPAPNFGQAWPTLVYMPFTAFMDPTQRYLATGGNIRAATDDFFKYVGPHEVAHQWWGHIVGWKSYRDQWMSEGFAEFSASLYAQAIDGNDKFIKFWEDQRQMIVESRPQTKDRKPYTVGPVTQGYRLNSGKTGNVARFMIYPKGAYILHMLRMMMYDRKTHDQHFSEMMQDFIKANYNKDVSTEDFKRAVERHMTKEMDIQGDGRMDWFFDEWVYGTEVPSYKFEYSVSGNTLSGRLTQSGVSDNFRMLVPVYLDFGQGWTRLGSATITGNTTVDLGQIPLPQAPKRAAIAVFKDVLAVNMDSDKK
ncbi:MAG TPA: carboxypeptidase regulatory-like domain-containing protein [Pyrinomonadaceae bacterium]|nr:carboxypeptidase regulatory-like domain-containing protein [Pyrinomonadaceae bacterium]